MGVRVERIDLPGFGVRNDVITDSGCRVSVVSLRTGERDLAFFNADDPDSNAASISLSDDEAAAIAEVLGSSLTLSRLSVLGEKAEGLFTEEISLPRGSGFVGHPMGDMKARTRTSASIVAIARDSDVIPSPGPEVELQAGDVIVAVGTRKGLDALSKLISNGPS